MKERFFTPWSLARVAEAVEWEGELVFAKDGSSNQEQYMKALSILWERWMRNWTLPDLASVLKDAGAQNWASAFAHSLETLKSRVEQLFGFYQGLWAGANPGRSRAVMPTWPLMPELPPAEDQVLNSLQFFFEGIRALWANEEEEG